MLSKRIQLKTTPPLSEQRNIQLADKSIRYTLIRSAKRRSIGLQINDAGLTVSVPIRASEKWLLSVLHEKASWVVDKLENWQSKQLPVQKWLDGESILFRGETFILRITPGLHKSPTLLTDKELVVPVVDVDDKNMANKKIMKWYRIEAERVFAECVTYFAPLMNVTPRAIKLSSATTQWGSCNTQGVVRLNWQLVTMPLHLIDYVVVHELAHLHQMNHSPAFWRVVQNVCPEYVDSRKELMKWSPAAPLF